MSWPASSAGSSSLSFLPCAGSADFSCASLTVPLDRTNAVSGTVSLSIERKLAGAAPSPDAVVAIAGGPGQAILPLAQFVGEAIAPALATRDLLLFDQRGTGMSDPLSCAALSNSVEASTARSTTELVERCALQLGPARGDYTTLESVEDIEAIRAAAGYEKLVLYGTSYGTKVALEYAQRYPQHVEALVLDSTETPEGPEPFHVSTFRAMKPALAELCSAGACNGVSANPLGDLAHLVAYLNSHSVTGEAYDEHGRRFRGLITSAELFDMVLAGDLNPVIRAELPAVVHSAVQHDLGPLARLLTLNGIHPKSEERSSEVDETLFIDTSCEETPFPWRRSAPETTRAVEAEAALNALPSSDFYPFDPESALLDLTIPLCVSWPDASAAPAAQGSLPDVPTLILSGGQDLRTPTEDARHVADLIPDAQLLRVPYTGHSVIGSDLSGCASAGVEAFFAGRPVAACAPVRNPFPPAPLAPTRLSSVTPTPGVPAAEARTVAAVLDTILDLRRSIVEIGLDFGQLPVGVRFGGLRGGTVKLTSAGAQLDRLSYVPGVQVSGLISTALLLKNRGSTASLGVGGSAASAGHMRVASGGHLSGVLAGRSFHVDVAARVRVARRGGEGGEPEWLTGPVTFPLGPLGRLR